ncbi:MotA/TolQ/ExbB proton channel family protein [Sphingomonas sp. dw_22]|uniref:DUF2341 domain-containing protein n=1 Tax=Sphingomonas sp. dw_22 TaxID=2721175 RepID=UPI001BD1CCA6
MGRTIIAWLIAFFAITSPAFAQTSSGWWNKEWPYRRAVTVDTSPTGANLSGAIGRTVLLVRLHNGNFTFSDALENGADLRMVDTDGKTPLPFHIERYDAANGIATLWVSVPNLAGGEKRRIWVYFGNKNAPAGSDIAGTYDPDTVAVYHFSEAGGKAAADVTANANNAQNAAPAIDENGVIARAAKFAGSGELIIPASASLASPAGGPLTIESWVKSDQPNGEQAVFTHGPLILGLANGVPFALVGEQRVQASAAVKTGEWTHLGFVADDQGFRFYVNGVEAAAGTGPLPALDGPITLGGGNGRPFTGELDEVRLSKTARPAAMILANAQSEGPGNKIVAVSDQAERQSAGGGNFFYVLAKIEIIDAVIIGLCMVILLLAIVVMITKARYINRAVRANKVFLKRFRALHEHLISMKQVEGIGPRELAVIEQAPLARLYETGVEELEVRRGTKGARRALSGEAVEAMRAAVDAEVVAENQKFDRWLVLLTIAISGGPFIGLLGTVLGVMNTFAGVAQAGDVNVNAIAPGIAAALMATIAGLACAIPSLFGYNYLNSRISEISDEMRVFVDRLITRLAEMQSDGAPSLQAAE